MTPGGSSKIPKCIGSSNKDRTLNVGAKPPPDAQAYGILYPRAGTFGSCTAMNSMITVLTDASEWDKIRDVTGDESWSARHMGLFFQRILERNQYLPGSSHDPIGWLASNFINLDYVMKDRRFLNTILGAFGQRGRGTVRRVTDLTRLRFRDLNSHIDEKRVWPHKLPLSVRNGARSSSNEFIKEVMQATELKLFAGRRPSFKLDVLLRAHVTRIIFDTSNPRKPRAIGLEYAQGESLCRADPRARRTTPLQATGSIKVRREIIISAGAFNTPQLLKLSGIGPEEELSKFQIPVVVDLPGVGTNLQDRYQIAVVAKTAENFWLYSKCKWLGDNSDPCLEAWKKRHFGPSRVAPRGEYVTPELGLAVLQPSSVSADGSSDVLITGGPMNFRGYYTGYSSEVLRDNRHWTWLVSNAHSRNQAGTVRLRSNDSGDTPIINFNSFQQESSGGADSNYDAQAMAEGVSFARSALKNAPKQTSPLEEVWPGPMVQTPAQVKDFIEREAWGNQASCSCPIGADSDPMAVLDSNFQVRGVDHLRVVDASVFPRIPGHFIALPIYMISEKAANVIHQAAHDYQPPD